MGPNENICNECVKLFHLLIDSEPTKSSQFKQTCAFCGISGDEIRMAGVSNFICCDCLEMCKQQIEENQKRRHNLKLPKQPDLLLSALHGLSNWIVHQPRIDLC